MSKILGKYKDKDVRTDRVRDVKFSLTPIYTHNNYIKEKIKTVVLTRKGELLLDPEFGTSVFDLLFSNASPEALGEAKRDISKQIRNYIEEINQVKIELELKDEYNITIKIYYNINNTDEYLEIDYAFNF